MTVNKNRKIQLYLSDQPSNNWRSNLKRILEDGGSDRKGTNLFGDWKNLEEDTVVDSNIDLLMANAPKSPVTRNTYSTPVNSFVSSITGTSLGGKLSSLIKAGANVISAWNDVKTNNANTNGRTAQVFQPWMKNVKAWTGAEGGITFEYEFKFNMGQYGLWNAKKEVVLPIINLVAPAFPQYLDNWGMAGPFPSTSELLLRMFSNKMSEENYTSNESAIITGTDGESPKTKDFSTWALDNLSDIGNILATLVKQAYNNVTYTIEFGNIIRFDKLIILNATTSFSNEVDQDGFPISGTAKLTFEGLIPLALVSNASYNVGDSTTYNYGSTSMFTYTRYGEV